MKGAIGQQMIVPLLMIDFVGHLLLIYGNFAALFTSNATLGRLLSVCGSLIFIVTCFLRLCTKFPSAATRNLDCAASIFEAIGSVSFGIAELLIYNGILSFVWLYITGNILFFIGGLMNAANVYKILQMKGLQDTSNEQGPSQSNTHTINLEDAQ